MSNRREFSLLTYLDESREPLNCLAFVFPILAVYECGVRIINIGRDMPRVNGADAVLKHLFQWAGFYGSLLSAASIVLVLIVLHLSANRHWHPRVINFPLMIMESFLVALPLFALNKAVNWVLPSLPGDLTGCINGFCASAHSSILDIIASAGWGDGWHATSAIASDSVANVIAGHASSGNIANIIAAHAASGDIANVISAHAATGTIVDAVNSAPDTLTNLIAAHATSGGIVDAISGHATVGALADAAAGANAGIISTASNIGPTGLGLSTGIADTAQALSLAPCASSLSDMGPIERMVLCMGAGVYEEFLFRLLLVGGGLALVKQFSRTHTHSRDSYATGGITSGTSTGAQVFVVLLSAIVFAVFHHLPPHGDPVTIRLLAFRTIAGVYFGWIYLSRGLGIATGCHTIYNLLVVGLNMALTTSGS